MTNKEKFLALVSEDTNNTMDYIRERINKRSQLRESARIAWKVLDKLEELGWSQKDLAEKMEVSPQQVNKIVKGQENLTLATLVKLQEILSIPLLASFHENALEKLGEMILNSIRQTLDKPKARILNMSDYPLSSKDNSVKMLVEEGRQAYDNYTPQVG